VAVVSDRGRKVSLQGQQHADAAGHAQGRQGRQILNALSVVILIGLLSWGLYKRQEAVELCGGADRVVVTVDPMNPYACIGDTP